jgi:hypothetical protein
MSKLTGQQVAQLQAALLDAFDQAELTQMMKVDLGEDLDSIVGGRTRTEVVFNLLGWADRHGRVSDLVRSAQALRPASPALATLAAELGGAPGAATPSPAAAPAATSAAGAITIGTIEAANVGQTQIINQQGAVIVLGDRNVLAGGDLAGNVIQTGDRNVATGGGAYIAGSVNTGGGDFVGRDKIVQGDAVQGDKITVGDVSGTAVAIGRGASASVQQGPRSAELAQALAPVVEAIQRTAADAAAQATAMQAIADLEQELAQGKGADDTRVAGILDVLADLVPGAVAAVVGAFATPLLSGMAGPVTRYVLGQLRRRQE